MEYAKQGYVVKEEEVDALDREQFNIPDRKFFETILEDSLLKEASIRKILYIHKFYYKVSLGIDFSKIMYALEDGKVLFYGVRFQKLHDITSEMEPEHGDIDRVEILKISGDKTEIRQDKEYEPLKEQYRNVRAQEVKVGMEEEVTALCGAPSTTASRAASATGWTLSIPSRTTATRTGTPSRPARTPPCRKSPPTCSCSPP